MSWKLRSKQLRYAFMLSVSYPIAVNGWMLAPLNWEPKDLK